ncbi:hypothetical protein HETIRDRAFT_108021 [Heterobasidion irregulare TC 32-1]|uniref:Uncharacterized protein n=1 Tax=Heterobasidion irregulare (strain TC 32-1) TaxID=747525 RepID=W4JRB7_HETIT|nr:uncharacterized protein HETIRDRAFT_108021 [Heterobasidion irregulare TC 32-1]ETW75411.1 hypothetical protein HETIRDRAFT_108021 [Heterobasidion irregulare TC 32-1]
MPPRRRARSPPQAISRVLPSCGCKAVGRACSIVSRTLALAAPTPSPSALLNPSLWPDVAVSPGQDSLKPRAPGICLQCHQGAAAELLGRTTCNVPRTTHTLMARAQISGAGCTVRGAPEQSSVCGPPLRKKNAFRGGFERINWGAGAEDEFQSPDSRCPRGPVRPAAIVPSFRALRLPCGAISLCEAPPRCRLRGRSKGKVQNRGDGGELAWAGAAPEASRITARETARKFVWRAHGPDRHRCMVPDGRFYWRNGGRRTTERPSPLKDRTLGGLPS